MPLFVALGFWAIGLLVWLVGQRGPTVAFLLAGASVLPAGLPSALDSDVGGRLFYGLLAYEFIFLRLLLGPLTYGHNVRLMEQARATRQELAHARHQALIAREQERRRLAQELHDGALQQLLGISYQIADIQRAANQGSFQDSQGTAKLVTSLETSRHEILGVVSLLRRLAGELRSGGLEEFGLTGALEGYVARLERGGGSEMPEIELDVDQTEQILPQPAAICLFRAAQEGLRNALKHACAKHIRLTLRVLPDEVMLVVGDDGRGFRVPARVSELTRTDHFGLVGIAERASLAGGRLVIRSQPGRGTELAIQIPLDKVEADDDQDDSSIAGR